MRDTPHDELDVTPDDVIRLLLECHVLDEIRRRRRGAGSDLDVEPVEAGPDARCA